jgi:hypothetical protein
MSFRRRFVNELLAGYHKFPDDRVIDDYFDVNPAMKVVFLDYYLKPVKGRAVYHVIIHGRRRLMHLKMFYNDIDVLIRVPVFQTYSRDTLMRLSYCEEDVNKLRLVLDHWLTRPKNEHVDRKCVLQRTNLSQTFVADRGKPCPPMLRANSM